MLEKRSELQALSDIQTAQCLESLGHDKLDHLVDHGLCIMKEVLLEFNTVVDMEKAATRDRKGTNKTVI